MATALLLVDVQRNMLEGDAPVSAAGEVTPDVDRLVLAGMQSEYCIQATSHGALGHGFQVVLVSDAHATYDDSTSAADISAAVERDLRADGVHLVPASDVEFR